MVKKEDIALSESEDSSIDSVILSAKEKKKLAAKAEELVAEYSGKFTEADYEMLQSVVTTMLEEMTKRNKVKYTPKKYKKQQVEEV